MIKNNKIDRQFPCAQHSKGVEADLPPLIGPQRWIFRLQPAHILICCVSLAVPEHLLRFRNKIRIV